MDELGQATVPTISIKLKPLRGLLELKDNDKLVSRLTSVDWAFTEDNTTYLSHDLHPYPSKFIPQIPANFIAALSLPGETVWDPFGGSGTTAFEALLQGRAAVSTDANPIATLVATAKCCTLSPEQVHVLTKLGERFNVLANSKGDASTILSTNLPAIQARIPSIPNVDRWFHPRSVEELAYLALEIERFEDPTLKTFAQTSFSAIVVKASWQDGETRYSSKPRDVQRGEVFKLFSHHLLRAIAKHKPIHTLLGYRKASVETLDLRHLSPSDDEGSNGGLSKESVDLIVTSPPYANANDYHLYHRFRLFWLGQDPLSLASCEIGSHLRHQRETTGFEGYLNEMMACLRTMYLCLRPGRFAVIVVGDSVFEGETICTADELAKGAQNIGFSNVALLERSVHRTKRSFIPPARRARAERILVLRKPPRRLSVSLRPVRYKLWNYEEFLLRKEVTALLGRTVPTTRTPPSIQVGPFELDRLRRLTFTDTVKIAGGAAFRTWQSVLENGDSSLAKENARKDPKYVTHGIHPYKGKFYPQLAKSLLNLSGVTEGKVLDPFCGSGTVLLEAQLNGLDAVGFDLNPLAVLIAGAKTAIVTKDLYKVDLCIHDFLDDIKVDKSTQSDLRRFPASCLDEILSWFPLPVARSLGWILNQIERVPIISLQQALKVCLSSIIRDVSQQDPKDLRIRRRKQPLENAPTLSLFIGRVVDLRRRLRDFAVRKVSCPNSIGAARVILGDSGQWSGFSGNDVRSNSIDVVVTSPPYATALPYIDTDRLSLLTILGIPSKERSSLERALTGSREIQLSERKHLEEMIENAGVDLVGSPSALKVARNVYSLNLKADTGFRRKNMGALLLRYFRGLYSTLKSVDKAVKSGSSLFIVLGNNYTTVESKRVVIENTKYIVEMGTGLGWTLVEEIPITVTKEGLRHAKHSITKNSVVWFRS